MIKAFGWAIRHMINVRNNYFGVFCHFVTLEEYRLRHQHNMRGDPVEHKYRPGKVSLVPGTRGSKFG
jgi:hypothetical protein